jgi:hypothetical protein
MMARATPGNEGKEVAPRILAGGEQDGTEDLGAGNHHNGQRQDCQQVHAVSFAAC